MSRPPRVGLLAGHSVDAVAWCEQVHLPEIYRWQILKQGNEVSLLDLDAWVWLWNPALPVEQLAADKSCIKQWVQSTLRTRQNRLIPMLIVATAPIPGQDQETPPPALEWLQSTAAMLKQGYHQELKGWMPKGLTDYSAITLQAVNAEDGKTLCERLGKLQAGITHWTGRIQRQAERCLAVGLVLTVIYLTLLLITIPWKASEPKPPKPADPLNWSRSDWQYHLTDCRQLLDSMQGRSFEKLTVPEQQRFTEHLRWLPISHDLLEQRRPTKEVLKLRGQVDTLLSQMEQLVDSWTKTPATSPVEQAAQQSLTQQLLESVFEPRRPPTVLHQAAQRYWLGERAMTLHQVKETLAQPRPLQIKLAEVLLLLRGKLTQAENSRVHAPELKTAWLQELSASITWIEQAQAQAGGVKAEALQSESTPTLLREAK